MIIFSPNTLYKFEWNAGSDSCRPYVWGLHSTCVKTNCSCDVWGIMIIILF